MKPTEEKCWDSKEHNWKRAGYADPYYAGWCKRCGTIRLRVIDGNAYIYHIPKCWDEPYLAGS